MQRRNFIKGACKICLLGTAAMIAIDLSSCSPAMGRSGFKTMIKDNKIEIPLSLFDNQPFQIISPEKFQYEIAVQKMDGNIYRALLLKCTHYENQLTATGNGFACNAHGSRFNKDGDVLKGPAALALHQLNTQIINNNLSIHLT